MRDTTAADSWARNYWNILEKSVDWSSFQTLSAIQNLGQSMGSSMADQDIVVRPGDAAAPVAVAPVAPVAGPAHVRPQPLWQPWSDSDGKANGNFSYSPREFQWLFLFVPKSALGWTLALRLSGSCKRNAFCTSIITTIASESIL